MVAKPGQSSLCCSRFRRFSAEVSTQSDLHPQWQRLLTRPSFVRALIDRRDIMSLQCRPWRVHIVDVCIVMSPLQSGWPAHLRPHLSYYSLWPFLTPHQENITLLAIPSQTVVVKCIFRVVHEHFGTFSPPITGLSTTGQRPPMYCFPDTLVTTILFHASVGVIASDPTG